MTVAGAIRLLSMLYIYFTVAATSEAGQCGAASPSSCPDSTTLLQSRVQVDREQEEVQEQEDSAEEQGEQDGGELQEEEEDHEDHEEDLEEHEEHEDQEENSYEDGSSLLELSPHSVNDASRCHVQGTFKHPKGHAKFEVSESAIHLAIPDLPVFTQIIDGKAGTSHVFIGNASAHVHEPESQEYIAGAEALARSDFAANARSLSHALYLKGFDGGSAPCTYPLHMLMVNLVSASQTKRRGRATVVLQTEESNTKWSPYGYDSECPLNGGYIARRRDTSERTQHRRRNPAPYEGGRKWYCRKESGLRRRLGTTQSWVYDQNDYLARSRRRRGVGGHRRRRRFSSSDPLNPKHGNLKCTDSDFRRRVSHRGHCLGLCGATCNCWESMCGDNYRCNYNPVCCAHDYACKDNGYLSIKCLSINAVASACANSNLDVLDGR